MRLICDWSANEAEECDEQSLGTNDSGSQSTQTSKHAKPVSSKRQSSQMDNAILKELKWLTSSIRRIKDQVYCLESKGYRSSSPWPYKKRRVPASRTPSSSSCWANRQDDQVDYSQRLDSLDDEDSATESPTSITLSEDNTTLITSSFTIALPNATRQKVRSNFPLPEIQETRCPRLDRLFKSSSLGAEAKAADAKLTCLQSGLCAWPS